MPTRYGGGLPSDITIYAAKADYTKPFANGLKMEAGFKSAFTETDNEAAYTNTVNGQTTVNYDLSNRFLYDEWIDAAYLNFSKTFGRPRLASGLAGGAHQFGRHAIGQRNQTRVKVQKELYAAFPHFFRQLATG